jgi:hypothetical protein
MAWWLAAVITILVIALLPAETLASTAATGLRIVRSNQPSKVVIDRGGGQILMRYINPGVAGKRTSTAMSPVLRTIAGKDTAGAGTSARTFTVPAAFSDSLHLGSVPRNLQVFVYSGTAAHIAAGNIIVTGTDAAGAAVIDTIAITADTVLHGQGTKCFWTVTTILLPAQDNVSVRLYVARGFAFGLPATTSSLLRWFKNGIPQAIVVADSLSINTSVIAKNYWKSKWAVGTGTIDALVFIPPYQGWTTTTKW